MKKFLSAILALAMIVSVVSVCGVHVSAAKALPEGVLYYWGFENDSDLAAVEQLAKKAGGDGPASYDLIPANRKPDIAKDLGVSGNALHLDGTYGVKLTDLEKIDLDAYTISFWVYSTKTVDYAPVVQFGSNMTSVPMLGDTTWMKFFFTPENEDTIRFPQVEMFERDAAAKEGTIESLGLTAIIGGEQEYGFILGNWQMVTLVVDGEKFTTEDGKEHVGTKLYMDGKLIMEANAEQNDYCAAMPGLLAGDFAEGLIGINYQEELFEGYVDELYIFDRALSEEAIQKVMDAGTPTYIPPETTPKILAPVVTKNPTSETVTEGGEAYFVARGENYNYINWYIVSADHGTRIPVNSAPWNFSGVSVYGEGTTTLKLSNIPLSMNGWCVEAVFTGDGGTATSSHCFVYVNKAAKAPLYAVPSSGFYTSDKSVQLTAAPGNSIYYELYDEVGFAHTGTIKSGDYITIPLVSNCRYVARLVAWVVGDESNLTVCDYTMDGMPVDPEPIPPTPDPEPVPPTPDPEPDPQPGFNGGTFSGGDVAVVLNPSGSDSFYANLSVLRLCSMDGAGNYSNGTVTMFLTDPNGNPVGASFNVGSGTVAITYSTWELLPEGTTYYGIY